MAERFLVNLKLKSLLEENITTELSCINTRNLTGQASVDPIIMFKLKDYIFVPGDVLELGKKFWFWQHYTDWLGVLIPRFC